jgi:cellobiose epimerase
VPGQMPTAEELEAVLRRDVLDVWFPRCLDEEQGGLLCDFDRAWRPCGPHEKLLEFQARQTWLAAELLAIAPGDERLRRASAQGFRFLRDVMWDDQFGGWFHRVNRAGEPLEAHTKHVHGFAYAISGCVAVHAATEEPGALDLAREAFAWIERYAHDDRHGGYLGFLRRDGTVIRDESESPLRRPTDTNNTQVGLKDVNVHCDLLESFIYLYRAWPDPKVGDRLSETVDVLSERMSLASGALAFYCQPDWRPVPHVTHHGYTFQTAARLLAARDLLDEDRALAVARRMVDFSLRHAWDGRIGGFASAGPASLPTSIEGHDLVVRRKAWWVQFEALKALLSLSRADDDAHYLRFFQAQWHYVRRFLLDPRHDGVYPVGRDTLPHVWRRLGPRFAPGDLTRKGSVWKDGSHDGRALLSCIATLRARGGGAA